MKLGYTIVYVDDVREATPEHALEREPAGLAAAVRLADEVAGADRGVEGGAAVLSRVRRRGPPVRWRRRELRRRGPRGPID